MGVPKFEIGTYLLISILRRKRTKGRFSDVGPVRRNVVVFLVYKFFVILIISVLPITAVKEIYFHEKSLG